MNGTVAWNVEEIDAQLTEVLPVRETLFSINVTNVIAVNLAMAVNAASFGTIANALAAQQIAVYQH